MSTLNLDDDLNPPSASKAPLIIRTIVFTVLGLAILVGTTANVYFYFKLQETESKLKSMQDTLADIDRKLATIRSESSGDDLSSEIGEANDKLDALQTDVRRIKSDVESMQSDINSIESDVSSIQLKVGY